MLTTAYYFLQVILCSGLMMGYYWLVLRNKRFHQYNRFYLLAIALLSWVVPLVKIKWGRQMMSSDPRMMRFLSVVADNNSQIEENLTRKGFQWSWDAAAGFMYVTIAGILLLGMLRAFFRLYQLLKTNSCKSVGEVYLIITRAKGTPFSFFRYIFWNEEIDIRSEAGKQILQHELTHVRQKHSFDKIFIQVVLIAGWFNPFFWLIRKEMDMIHEFIADRKAVNEGDTASLAQMLLTAAYPQQQFALSNPFFFSPIKRRLKMLTNHTNPRFSYIRRLIVLPLLAIVVVLFAFRNKEERKQGTLSVATVVENVVDAISATGSETTKSNISVFDHAMLDRPYTVVIDAGHGGTDKGVTGADGTSEAQITLQLAKQIKELNANENIRIVLTRDADIFQTVVQKAELANQSNPDLFISLHCNDMGLAQGSTTGIEMFIASKNKTTYYEASQVLAGQLTASLQNLNEKMIGTKSREKGIWVLQNVQSPAVLIEAGFISNTNDLQKLKTQAYQQQMANAILQGINHFLSKPVQTQLNMNSLGLDTVVIKQKGQEEEVKVNILSQSPALLKALIILDGKKVDNKILELLDPKQIATVDVLKGESGMALYGEEGKNGVVVIRTSIQNSFPVSVTNVKRQISQADTTPAITSATVIGYDAKENAGVKNFLKRNPSVKNVYWWAHTSLKMQVELKNGSEETYDLSKPASKKKAEVKYGKLPVAPPLPPVKNSDIVIQDIKLEKGNAKELTFTLTPNTTTAKTVKVPGVKIGDQILITALNSVRNFSIFSAWVVKDNLVKIRFINFTHKPIIISGNDYKIVVIKAGNKIEGSEVIKFDHVFTEVQILAEFPGGIPTWTKYLERNLNKDIVKNNGGPPGKYTVVVSFVISKTGTISEVTAENDPGYGTKDEAIRLIIKGPKWKPALQNGKAVVYKHRQSITFFVPES
ncbi:MAG: N-acetylmuramoyl-L-alanine amidase [Chitinophagaceae bacterium]|nr:N-acetylmuramoyl-L-alanine amidase [Chitinophagaceae bacterium]